MATQQQAGEGQQSMCDKGARPMAWLVLPVLAASSVGFAIRAAAGERGAAWWPQKMLMPIWVWRQPTSAMKCWMKGGQTTPERELPIVAKERWRGRGAGRTTAKVCHQRREARRAAEADGQTRDDRKDRQGRSESGEDAAKHMRIVPPANGGDAEPVRQPADRDAADHEADHCRRVGQGSAGPMHAEFSLYCRQRYSHRPQANAAERAEGDQYDEPEPGIRRFH